MSVASSAMENHWGLCRDNDLVIKYLSFISTAEKVFSLEAQRLFRRPLTAFLVSPTFCENRVVLKLSKSQQKRWELH